MGVARVPLSKYVRVYRDRVRTESWILEKVLKFAQQFSDLKKVWKVKMKSGKMVKSLDFFFVKPAVSAFIVSEFFFFRFGRILLNLARAFGIAS